MKNLQALKLNSRFQRHSLNLFFIRFFSTVASFVVIYYYSHHLSEADYGQYQTVWTRSYFLSAFAGIGIASLVYTYTPAVLRQLIHTLSFKTYFLLLIIPVACSVVFAFMQAPGESMFAIYLLFFLVYVASTILETLLGALHLFRFLSVISFIYGLCFCWVHYYAFRSGYNVHVLFTLLLPLLLLRIGAYLLILKTGMKNKQLQADSGELPERMKMKSLWKHLYFFEASQIIILYADKFLLSQFLPEAQFAVYFNATIAIPFIGLVFSAINNAAFMEYAHQESDEKKISILHRTGKVLSSVAIPCFYFLFFFSEEIFSILFSDKYLASVPIFKITLLALPLRSIYAHTLVLQSNHKGNIINKGVVIDVVVSLLLFAPLYYMAGLKGVVLSFVLGTLAQAVYYLISSGRVMRVSALQLIPIKNWVVKFLLYGLGILSIHYGLSSCLPPVPVLFTGGAFIIGISAVLFWKEFR